MRSSVAADHAASRSRAGSLEPSGSSHSQSEPSGRVLMASLGSDRFRKLVVYGMYFM